MKYMAKVRDSGRPPAQRSLIRQLRPEAPPRWPGDDPCTSRKSPRAAGKQFRRASLVATVQAPKFPHPKHYRVATPDLAKQSPNDPEPDIDALFMATLTLTANGRRRDLRSCRGRILSLLRRSLLANSAFRENAVRQRSLVGRLLAGISCDR